MKKKTLFYKTGSLVRNFIPLSLLIKITGQKFVCPFYHAVTNEPAPHLNHLKKFRSTVQFEKDLDFLLKHYQVVAIKDVIRQRKLGANFSKNSFLLSFDDGLREFHDIVAPILLRKGIPAVCFLNSAFIDNRDMFYRHKASLIVETLAQKDVHNPKLREWFLQRNRADDQPKQYVLSINYTQKHELDELATIIGINFSDYAQQQQPYLTSEQINRLIAQGFSFGGHSIDHPLYANLPAKSQIHQTVQSINTVSTNFNLDYKVFAFPFTDSGISKAFFNTIFDGNNPLADLSFGSAGLKNDECHNNIQRIAVENGDFSLKEVMYGEYLYYVVKSMSNNNKIARI